MSRRLVVLLFAAATVLLAACSDDGGSGSAADTGGEGSGDAAMPDAGGDAGGDGGDICNPAPSSCAPGDTRPSRLSEHAAAFDDSRQWMIVHGGSTSIPDNCARPVAEFVDTTWLFDAGCGTWTEVAAAGPSARGRHSMAFGNGAAWLFGGRFRSGGSGAYTVFDEMWRFDPEAMTWEQMPDASPAPTPRWNAAMAWDSSRELLWVVGGNQSSSGATDDLLNDVWSYDPATNEWSEEPVLGGPEPRLQHTMFYDADRDRLVVFGGADATRFLPDAQYYNDVWVLDLGTMSWSELPVGGSLPEGRFWSRMVHDTVNDVYLLFAGHDDASLGNVNDVWIYDPVVETWDILAPGDQPNAAQNGFCDFPADFTTVDTSLPERRNAHTMVWSETCGRAYVFAGKTDCGAADDVWYYDANDDAWVEALEAFEGEACLRFRDNPDNCSNMCF